MEEYLPILEELQNSNVTYKVIGTWALKAYYPKEMQDYSILDCDLVLFPSLENIYEAIKILTENNWTVTVWEQPIPLNAPHKFFEGKFYMRGKQKSLILDLIYECIIPWEDLYISENWISGIPLASISNILPLKKLKASEQNTLDDFRKLIKKIPQSFGF
jgi:hypothetical protein